MDIIDTIIVMQSSTITQSKTVLEKADVDGIAHYMSASRATRATRHG